MVRSFPDPKTSRKPLAGMLTGGILHLVRFAGLSVRYQPARFVAELAGFWISIQSVKSPSTSARMRELLARNSEMNGWLLAGAADNTRKPAITKKILRNIMGGSAGIVPPNHRGSTARNAGDVTKEMEMGLANHGCDWHVSTP